jgi:hypothetical protein
VRQGVACGDDPHAPQALLQRAAAVPLLQPAVAAAGAPRCCGSCCLCDCARDNADSANGGPKTAELFKHGVSRRRREDWLLLLLLLLRRRRRRAAWCVFS